MNQTKFPYGGHFLTNCIVPDNLKYCKDLLRRRSKDKNLQREVEFYQTFEAGTRYDRLVAHRLAIYGVLNPQWKAIGNVYSFPVGELELLIDVDLGVVLKTARQKVREEIVEKKITIPYPDGTFVRGKRIRLVAGNQELERLESYIELRHDLQDRETQDKDEFWYKFRIKKEALSPDHPMEFHITQYYQINNLSPKDTTSFVIMMAWHEKRRKIHFKTKKKDLRN